MHPQILKHEPGNCPICGMKLVPLRPDGGEVSADASGSSIHVTAALVQRMNVKTAVVTRGPVKRQIRTVGTVAYDEAGLRVITAKYDGWIERLFVDKTWARVKPGDPLFEIYSPDLYNAELNYCIARGSEGDTDGPLTHAALGRLRLFDLPTEALAELNKSGRPARTLVFPSPAAGIVVEKPIVAGQMVKAGEPVLRLADLSQVWILARLYEQDLPFVNPGQTAKVSITYGLQREYVGTVSLVVPEIEPQTRTATARIVLANPEHVLRPGMYVDVRLDAQIADDAVLVPDTAVVRSGDHNTVFVAKTDDTFEPRSVTLGARTGSGDDEVLSGLSAGERVVTSGQFMLDSESQLQAAIDRMQPPDAHAVPAVSQGSAPVTLSAGAANAASALKPIALATADAAAALANDNLAEYNRQREAVNAALGAARAPGGPAGAANAVGLPDGPLPMAADLKSARETFAPFSTAVTDVARAAGLDRGGGLHAFECPMPPSGAGNGRWLQRSAGTKNPFYGSAMPTCGEELK